MTRTRPMAHTLRDFSWDKRTRTLAACASDLGWGVGHWPSAFSVLSHHTNVCLTARQTAEEWRGSDDDREFVAMVYTIRVPGHDDITITVFND